MTININHSEEDEDLDYMDIRYEALARSVELHGAACRAPGAVPSRVSTVLKTAAIFAKYLETGDVPQIK